MRTPLPSVADGSFSVLVIDDDADHAALVAELIRDLGCDATFETDPWAALKRIEQKNFDLLVVDLRMPGMSGLHLIEQARSRSTTAMTAMLAMTAFGAPETGLRALHAGANAYLPKPFAPTELHAKVKHLLEDVALARQNEELRRSVEALLQRTRPNRSE